MSANAHLLGQASAVTLAPVSVHALVSRRGVHELHGIIRIIRKVVMGFVRNEEESLGTALLSSTYAHNDADFSAVQAFWTFNDFDIFLNDTHLQGGKM